MHTACRYLVMGLILAGALAGRAAAQEPVSLKTVKDPGPNQRDEPAAAFSIEKAVHFLDSAALNWQKQKNCFTCHTNYAYLYSRPLVSADAPALKEVRQFADNMVMKTWPAKVMRARRI